jgi:hypothetical protein
VILEAIVSPAPQYSVDVLRHACFHFRTMEDADKTLLEIEMNTNQNRDIYMDSTLHESCFDISRPIKIFYMKDEQIDDFREKAGISYYEDDEDNLIPGDVGKLFFICSFNDGCKSPSEISTEDKVLPDVFSMFYT